jgi:hypothetical protein
LLIYRKNLFGADDVEIDRELRYAELYFDSIEDGIRVLFVLIFMGILNV